MKKYIYVNPSLNFPLKSHMAFQKSVVFAQKVRRSNFQAVSFL